MRIHEVGYTADKDGNYTMNSPVKQAPKPVVTSTPKKAYTSPTVNNPTTAAIAKKANNPVTIPKNVTQPMSIAKAPPAKSSDFTQGSTIAKAPITKVAVKPNVVPVPIPRPKVAVTPNIQKVKTAPVIQKPVVKKAPSRVTYNTLAKASGIKNPNKIFPGQKVKLPSGGSYTVKKGDTLSGIAQSVRLGKLVDKPKIVPKVAPKIVPAVKPDQRYVTRGPDNYNYNSNQATNNKKYSKPDWYNPKNLNKNDKKVAGPVTKSIEPADAYTGKYIDKDGNVAYDSIKDFGQNFLPGIFGKPKNRTKPSNRNKIKPEKKGAAKGVSYSGESVNEAKSPPEVINPTKDSSPADLKAAIKYAKYMKAKMDTDKAKATYDKEIAQLEGWMKAKSVMKEGGMPSSVIKSKQRYAEMSNDQLADVLKDKDEKTLRQMAWRHGYGKMSSYYIDRIKSVESNEEVHEEYDPKHGHDSFGHVEKHKDKNGKNFWAVYNDTGEIVKTFYSENSASEFAEKNHDALMSNKLKANEDTSSGNVATVANPHTTNPYAYMSANSRPKKQKPSDNALNMKKTSIFGGPIKR
jgi:hypothetical protein